MAESPRVGSDGVVKLTILTNGAEIKDTYGVISVLIRKQINKIPYAIIVFEDGDMPGKDFPVSNTDDFKPGAEIEIKAGYARTEESVFKGIVVKHGIRIFNDNSSRLVVEAKDKAVIMTIGRKNANYAEDKKDSDVISDLIANYPALSSDVESTGAVYKELVQYYCTDWDFMLSRAEINGLLVAVEDAKVTVKSPRTSSAPKLKTTYGDDIMEFQAEMDALTQLKAATVTTWDPANQEIVDKEGVTPGLNDQGNISTDELASTAAPGTYTMMTSAPMPKEAAKSWADAQLLKSGLSKIRGRMKFQGSAKAKPGELIEVNGVGDRFNGDVFVSCVEHEIAAGNWTTQVEFGLEPDWFVEKNDATAPPAGGLLPGVEGLQIGVVQKLDEDPEGQHKIQVALPALKAKSQGIWARLASFYGSQDFGAFFIPEIGDEVVLGYLNNDPCHPVILGGLYSSSRNPPYGLTADNFIKAIVTRSKLKIEFDDENKVTTIETPDGNKIVFSDKDKSILVQDQNDNKMELSPDGIVIDSPKDIKITSGANIAIEAESGIDISSSGDVSVKGMNIANKADMGFSAKGGTSELSATGDTTIKGLMVMIN